MNARRVRAVARKEFLHVIRDVRSLGMAIALPMLMLFLFGFALTLDVDRVPLVVYDQSRSHASRELVSRFDGSRYFSLERYVADYASLESDIDSRRAVAALVIPYDFASLVESGRPSSLQLLVDASDSNTATLVISYAEFVTSAYSTDITARYISRITAAVPAAPLDLRPRVWFNTDLESRNYIIPGLIAVIMMVIAALLTSLTVAREWENGTMEQLISTPVLGSELLLGKLIPYFVIGLVDVALAVFMGEFVYDVPLRGSVALLFAAASVFMITALSLGLFISVITKSQLVANQLAMVLTFIPAFLLSGFVYPIANMPRVIQFVTLLIPARYFVALLKGIYLKGVGLEVLAFDAVLLTLFGGVTLLLANAAFRKKLA